MSDLWFEPSERVPSPPQTGSWSGFMVSLLGHAILISVLVWAGKQWVPVTPPQTIEVMLVEMPVEETPAAEPATVQPPPQAPTTPKPLAQRQEPAPQPAKAKVESVKPPPTPLEAIADINTGEKTPPPLVKNSPVSAAQPAAEPPKNVPAPADMSREVSPARVDARYASTNPRPQYPSMARRLGQEGTVVLEVVVSTEGLAKSVRIQESSGYELLDQAALQAISKWKFVPAKRGETPIEQKLNTRWTYKLEQ